MSTEFTTLHPAAATKIQQSPISFSEPKAQHHLAQLLDSNGHTESTLTLATSQLTCPPQTQHRISQADRKPVRDTDGACDRNLVLHSHEGSSFHENKHCQVQVCPLPQALAVLHYHVSFHSSIVKLNRK